MRLRYLRLQNYPPIQNMAVHFASGSPLERECAIRFVVGLNGSGKSNLLRAVAEVFLALADIRLPPFPVTLIYELGHRNSANHFTFIVDCPGSKSEAGIWVAERWHWADEEGIDAFETVVDRLRWHGQADHFRALVSRGMGPQRVDMALPQAVLAYTTGDLTPWSSIWNRNQKADLQAGFEEDDEERPADWTLADETAAVMNNGGTFGEEKSPPRDELPGTSSQSFLRPILLSPTLLKCALLAVVLPQAFIETADYPGRAELDTAMAALRGRADNRNALQELLERGGWHHLVSVSFRCRLQPRDWPPLLLKTAHDWLLCASEVIAEPHPGETRRVLHFDLKEPFTSQGLEFLTPNDDLASATSHGEALWALLGGHENTPFELFSRLLDLHQSGLFEDVEMRLRRAPRPDAGEASDEPDVGVLRYEELSDGEQMVLGRMALFHLLTGQDDALLLLDEPETHFNDAWKREIVQIIDEAIRLRASDVLISTHSAIVLSDVFNDEIVMVEKTGSGSHARTVDQQTFATDPSALMMTVFEADDSIGKRAQEFIEAKLRMAEGTTEDIRQVEQLIARMGSGFYRSELRTLLNMWRGGNA